MLVQETMPVIKALLVSLLLSLTLASAAFAGPVFVDGTGEQMLSPSIDAGTYPTFVGDGVGGVYIAKKTGVRKKITDPRDSTTSKEEKARITHISADGTVDRSFGPVDVWGVGDLLLSRGRLYTSSRYVAANGRKRYNLSALDARTGKLTSWAPVIGKTENGKPQQPFGGQLESSVSRRDLIFVNGYLDSANDQKRRNLAAFHARTGATLPWGPRTDARSEGDGGITQEIAVSGGAVYICGHFTKVNGIARHNLAKVEIDNGSLSSWSPDGLTNFMDGGTEAGSGYLHGCSADRDSLYVVGVFTEIGGVARDDAAAFDIRSGRIRSWAPCIGHLHAPEGGVAVTGGRVFVDTTVNESEMVSVDRTDGSDAKVFSRRSSANPTALDCT